MGTWRQHQLVGLLTGLGRKEGTLCLLSVGAGVTSGTVLILWQIHTLTLFIKDSLPGKNTEAWQPPPSLLFLLILFRWYCQPAAISMGGDREGGLSFSGFRQPA